MLINLVFICDILINFRTTYIHSKTAEEVMNPREIAFQYLKMKFWIDLLASIPFDSIGLILFSSSSSSMLRLFALLKLTRVLRLGKIIAIMKVKDDIKLSLRLFKLIFFLVLYLHCLGCIWYYIVIDSKNWLPPYDYVWIGTDYYDRNLYYRYFASVYHSILIFCGNDVGPRGDYQIVF